MAMLQGVQAFMIVHTAILKCSMGCINYSFAMDSHDMLFYSNKFQQGLLISASALQLFFNHHMSW